MIQNILQWIVFNDPKHWEFLHEYGIDSWDIINIMTTEDIDTMEKIFSSLTANNGKIIFGTNRTKYLKYFTHWTQEFFRISKVPMVVGTNG